MSDKLPDHHRLRANYDTILRLWQIVDQYDTVAETLDQKRHKLVAELEQHGFRQPLVHLVMKDVGLGPMARVALIRHAFGGSSKKFHEELCSELISFSHLAAPDETGIEPGDGDADSSLPPLVSKNTLDRFLEPGRSKPRPAAKLLTEDVQEALARIVNKLERRAGVPIKAHEIFRKPFLGIHAVANFWSWITDGEHALKQADGLLDRERARGFLTTNNRKRTKILDDLTDILFATESKWPDFSAGRQTSSPPTMLINLYQNGMWGGLSAIAAELMDRAEKKANESVVSGTRGPEAPLKCCYVPLLRQSGGGAGLSYPCVVAYIAGFLSGYEDPSSYPVPVTPAELANEIANIKRLMSVRPAVIFFDGYTDVDIGFYNIGRVITDNHIVRLATRLLEPPVVSAADPIDLDTFCRNRIVILSDKELTVVDKDLEFTALQKIEVPRASSEDMPAVLEFQKLKRRKELLELRNNIPVLASETSEAVFYALDTLVEIRMGAANFDSGAFVEGLRMVLDKGDGDPNCRLQLISKEIIDSLRSQDPEQLIILLIIAFSPGGVRQKTLETILRQWRSLNHRQELTRFVNRDEKLESQVSNLLAKMNAVITTQRDDTFEGYDRLPTRVGRDFNTARVYSPELAIDFTVPEIRIQFIKALDQATYCDEKRKLIHRLIAEENIRQQTEALRRGPDAAESSIRMYRRLVAGLYHGLLSIPFTGERGFGCIPAMPEHGVIPADARAAWTWLATQVYRRMLEQGGEWNLMRRFSMPLLKFELLLLLVRPWARDPESAGRPHVDERGTVFDLLDGSEVDLTPAVAKAIRVDLQTALTQTESALGRKIPSSNGESVPKIDTDSLAVNENSYSDDLRILKCKTDVAMSRLDRRKVDELMGIANQFIEPKIACVATTQGKYRSLTRATVALSHYFREMIGSRNFYSQNFQEAFLPVSRVAFEFLDGSSPELLTFVSDFMNRGGERLATIADIAHGESQLKGFGKDLHDQKFADLARVKTEFARAFSCFYLAEQAQLCAFELDPIAKAYRSGGHSIRTLVRTCLKLERLSKESVGANINSSGFFATYARRSLDVWARGLFRFDRERCSMLILESAMRRTYPMGDFDIGVLDRCIDDLRDAEALMMRMGVASRVRLRFLLERIKIYRRLSSAYLHNRCEEEATRFYKLAKFDQHQLTALARFHNSIVWTRLARLQDNRLARLEQELFLES